ncbi:MAG: GGDEF domain-containing protein [Micropepsaceae bacterium]
MQRWEATSEARELRALAQTLMDKYEIAPTPLNYELWFFYALGQDPELIKALDDAVRDHRSHDPQLAKELHIKFCSDKIGAELDAASLRLEDELKKISSALEVSGKGSNAYAMTLDRTAEQLSGTYVPAQLKGLVDTVAAATQLMAERNKALEAQVDASAREIDTMRSKMEAIRKESLTDALTDLANRRSFDAQLAVAIREANAESSALCALMCDIDHFKKFNDTWGHAAGDQVLRLVANCLRSNVKGRDMVARYGGEELVVILPKTSLDKAMMVAEQIRRSVESRKVVKKSTGETLGQVTLSIGGAEYCSGESAADFVARADACLYAAKRSGRNRVCSRVASQALCAASSA